jgi:hypothetical protein
MEIVFWCPDCNKEYESLTDAYLHIAETWPHHWIEAKIKEKDVDA